MPRSRMNKLPNHTALKEWSNVIEALGRGEQVILLRKGGIADPSFGVEAERFYFYPTYYHQSSPGAEPQDIAITHWCEAVRTWRVTEAAEIEKLLPFVVLPREAVETRYRFRPGQALHVIAVRTMRLAEPATIRVRPEYIGCRSWVSLEDEINVTGSVQTVGEDELQFKLSEVDRAIAASAARA